MDATKPKPKPQTANVYPNPANTQLNIQISAVLGTNQSKTEYFYLYDGLGKVIQTAVINNNFITIPLMRLSVGIYYYRIVDQDQNPIRTDKLLIIR
jgi:hypothetical protein